MSSKRHLGFVTVVSLAFLPLATLAEKALPPERTGATLPEARQIAGALDVGGMYTRAPRGFADDRAGILGGDITWNVRLVHGLGAFGKHLARSVILDNVTMLLIGHEAGLRLLLIEHLSIEAAYLTHRFEYKWVDGHPFGAGGLHDHGAELGMWGRFRVLSRLELGAHLFGRHFGEPNLRNGHHFADGQWAMGLGFRMGVEVFDGYWVTADIVALRVYRQYRRPHVETVTWNTVADVFLRGSLTEILGFNVGFSAGSDMYSGVMPVFETKRSMINHPVATGWVGMFFVI